MIKNIRDELMNLHSTSISDAQHGNYIMASYIKSIVPGVKLAGRAFTVKPVPGDHLSVLQALSTAESGDVLVIDGTGVTEVAYMGEMMSTFAQRRGLAGAVIDGAIRDKEGVNRIKFPVFARSIVPRSAVEESFGEIQIPVACGGVPVNPGDWILGDDDGVAVIPAHLIEISISGAYESEQTDEEIRQGADFMSFLGVDKLLKEKEKAKGNASKPV